jgi:hypothetical protein
MTVELSVATMPPDEQMLVHKKSRLKIETAIYLLEVSKFRTLKLKTLNSKLTILLHRSSWLREL